ncbi:MAG: flagellar export chaperone FlgN, partial [Phycisphaerales bacterium]|nr:flagellar export chaperone FlgN [Phycisphaerales bacterium]
MRAAERMNTENGLGRELAGRLEPVVLSLIEAHEALVKLLEQHRAAISAADARALGEVVRGETEVLTRIESLDRECREAMGHRPGSG